MNLYELQQIRLGTSNCDANYAMNEIQNLCLYLGFCYRDATCNKNLMRLFNIFENVYNLITDKFAEVLCATSISEIEFGTLDYVKRLVQPVITRDTFLSNGMMR